LVSAVGVMKARTFVDALCGFVVRVGAEACGFEGFEGLVLGGGGGTRHESFTFAMQKEVGRRSRGGAGRRYSVLRCGWCLLRRFAWVGCGTLTRSYTLFIESTKGGPAAMDHLSAEPRSFAGRCASLSLGGGDDGERHGADSAGRWRVTSSPMVPSPRSKSTFAGGPV